MESEVVRGIGLSCCSASASGWPAAWACPPSCCCWWVGSSSAGLDLVDPELIFGESLFPIVSLAVGLLLFNGAPGSTSPSCGEAPAGR